MSNITKRDFIKILPAAVPATLLSGVTGSLIAPALADTHNGNTPRISLDSTFVPIGDENKYVYVGFSSFRVENIDTEAYMESAIEEKSLIEASESTPNEQYEFDNSVIFFAGGLGNLIPKEKKFNALRDDNTRMGIARNLLQGANAGCTNPAFHFFTRALPGQIQLPVVIVCATVIFLYNILFLEEKAIQGATKFALDTSP